MSNPMPPMVLASVGFDAETHRSPRKMSIKVNDCFRRLLSFAVNGGGRAKKNISRHKRTSSLRNQDDYFDTFLIWQDSRGSASLMAVPERGEATYYSLSSRRKIIVELRAHELKLDAANSQSDASNASCPFALYD